MEFAQKSRSELAALAALLVRLALLLLARLLATTLLTTATLLTAVLAALLLLTRLLVGILVLAHVFILQRCRLLNPESASEISCRSDNVR